MARVLHRNKREVSGAVKDRPMAVQRADKNSLEPSFSEQAPKTVKLFPDGFLWGASTAGHQVEGGNYDQWTVWELAEASGLAKKAKHRFGWLENWDNVRGAAETPENYVSGKGVDHFHRYQEDFDILQELNLNAFRFSLEWSRVEPEEGVWNKAAFDHYHNYIAELRARGIDPVLNLWHWTCPVWFEEKGGFLKSSNMGYFLRFVGKVAEEFKDEVKFIITLNEPNVYATYSDLNGIAVPPHGSRVQRLLMYKQLVKVHRYAYQILKQANPDFQIGIAQQIANDQPKNNSRITDRLVARVASYVWAWWFLNRIKRHMDFVGINYYFTNYYNGFKQDNPKTPVNDVGWYMEPSGLGEVATKAWIKYHKPVFITENGVADADDVHRQWWLKETMLSLIKARRAGVELVGYMHWSLLDNFEWAYGWWPKFGLVGVDRDKNMKRSIRKSARWWAGQLEILKKS